MAKLDDITDKSYNDTNKVIDHSEGQVHRIDKRDLRPLNDANCIHEFYEDTADPDAEQFRVFKCKVQGCIVGYLLPL